MVQRVISKLRNTDPSWIPQLGSFFNLTQTQDGAVDRCEIQDAVKHRVSVGC